MRAQTWRQVRSPSLSPSVGLIYISRRADRRHSHNSRPWRSAVDAVLARSWAGVLQRDLFFGGSGGGSVELNSSDCLPHCNETCSALPDGWVQVSPAGQIDAGTLWSRDTGTFLRELVAFGELERAKAVALNLVRIAPVNAAGFRAWPGHYNCKQPQGQPNEQDGVSAIVIALVNLLQRLERSDPAYATLSEFLRGAQGPAKFFVQVSCQLQQTPGELPSGAPLITQSVRHTPR